MKNVCHIDFESRSTVGLLKAGAHAYAEAASTDALCMSYALNEHKVGLWVLGQPCPPLILECHARPDVVFVAHNAAFEFLIWNLVCVPKYGWPALNIKRLDCTMVRAYSMGLPGKLEAAAKAVGMPYEKDMKGHRIMLQLCRPRAGPEEHCPTCKGTGINTYSPFDGHSETCSCVTWWEPKDSTPKMNIAQKYKDLYRYCIQDTIVERELDKRVLPLSPYERKVWLLDQKINHNGVNLDEVAAEKAIKIVKSEQQKYNDKIKAQTDGFVNTCNSSVKLAQWITAQGIDCDSVAKAFVLDMLELDNLPDIVRNVLLLRQEASRSSVAKLRSMLTGRSLDGRVRGCFQYYGAPSTGRWAGRRIQLQNIKRPDIDQDDIDLIMHNLGRLGTDSQESRDYLAIFHGSVIKPISDCVRAMLIAGPGKTLIAPDYTAIEGRMLAWLAGQEDKLNVYRGHGKVYEESAGRIYGIPWHDVTKLQRLIGKVAELALGYQGGVGAFQSMAKVYFVKIPDTQAEQIKVSWRLANPHIVAYWYALERAAIAAVENPGQKFATGPKGRHVTFLKNGSFLFCRLPSGGVITYPYPKMKIVMTPWGEPKNAITYKAVLFGKFITKVAYGGLICNNVTQRTARDLLAGAMLRFADRGHDIVMHTHDEVVIEAPIASVTTDEISNIMCELEPWARDLPLHSSVWIGKRYRK